MMLNLNKKYILLALLLIPTFFLISCGSQTTKKENKTSLPNENISSSKDTNNINLDAKTVIKVLALYNEEANSISGQDATTRIYHFQAVANKTYADSNLDMRIKMVRVEKYAFNNSRSSIDTLKLIQKDNVIKKLRKIVAADEVLIYRKYANDSLCGIAYMNTQLQKEYAYAHVTIDCGASTTTHELGHTMGLGHSHNQNSKGIYTYAVGHGIKDNFTTVMAFGASFGSAQSIYKFSSPELECNEYLCGIEVGSVKSADAVKALRQTYPIVANFN